MRTRWSTAIRSGVPVGSVREIVAGGTGSTAARFSSEEGGAHSEALASSRGVSAQAEINRDAAGGALFGVSAADWPSATEAQASNDTGRHQVIRARCMCFTSTSTRWGRVPAFIFRKLDI